MSCNPLNYPLPAVISGDTWDGFTWSVADVPAGSTEFAVALDLAEFEIKDVAGTSLLLLTSATPGDVTINTSGDGAWSVTVEPRVLTLDPGVHTFGLRLTDADGILKTRLAGTLPIDSPPVS